MEKEVNLRKTMLRDHADVRASTTYVHWWQKWEETNAYREYQNALATALEDCHLSEAGRECGILDDKHEKPRAALAAVHGQLLRDAVRASQMDTVRALCVAGASIDDEDESGMTVLDTAVSHNLVEPTRYLLEHCPDTTGLLLVAAAYDADGTFKQCVEHFKQMRTLYTEVKEKSVDGFTVLHIAICNGNMDILNTCARYDEFAKIAGCVAEKQTALTKAALYGLDDALEILIDGLKADVHAWDGDGYQALHVAAKHGYSRCVDVLLARGADPESHDKTVNQLTPLRHCDLGARAPKNGDNNKNFDSARTLLVQAAAARSQRPATTGSSPRPEPKRVTHNPKVARHHATKQHQILKHIKRHLNHRPLKHAAKRPLKHHQSHHRRSSIPKKKSARPDPDDGEGEE